MQMDQFLRISVSTWFDTLLAILFPFLLFLAGRKMLSPFPWSTIRQLLDGYHIPSSISPFSLGRAHASYFRYALLARQDLTSMERSYRSIGRSHKHLGFRIGYPTKLQRFGESITQNAVTTAAIATMAADEFGLEDNPRMVDVNQADLARVREVLKHFVRDWSEEGVGEREKIFRPILRVLEQVPLSKRGEARVLVPGSGLGRLAWEISQLGTFFPDFDA
jgi:carnosine N-methyltransferase